MVLTQNSCTVIVLPVNIVTVASYSIDEFKTYMSEIDTLRKVNDYVVRTDHIIQAVISSSRMGYSGFESELYNYKFKGEDIDVTIEQYPFFNCLIIRPG